MANNNDVDVTVKRYTRNMIDLGDITDDELRVITDLVVLNDRRDGEPMTENKPLSPRIGSCSNMTTLVLVNCSLIPPEISNCTTLSTLILRSYGNEDHDCRIELQKKASSYGI